MRDESLFHLMNYRSMANVSLVLSTPCTSYVAISSPWIKIRAVTGVLYLLVCLLLFVRLKRYSSATRSRASFWRAPRVRFWIINILAAILEAVIAFDLKSHSPSLTDTALDVFDLTSRTFVAMSFICIVESLMSVCQRTRDRVFWITKYQNQMFIGVLVWQFGLYFIGKINMNPIACLGGAVARLMSFAIFNLIGGIFLCSQKSKIVEELVRAASLASPRTLVSSKVGRQPSESSRSFPGMTLIRSITSSSITPMDVIPVLSPRSMTESKSPVLRAFINRLRAVVALLFIAFGLNAWQAVVFAYIETNNRWEDARIKTVQLVSFYLDRIYLFAVLLMAFFAYTDQDNTTNRLRRRTTAMVLGQIRRRSLSSDSTPNFANQRRDSNGKTLDEDSIDDVTFHLDGTTPTVLELSEAPFSS